MKTMKNSIKEASQLIADCLPSRPKQPSVYQYLKQHNPNHHLVQDYEKAMELYEEERTKYSTENQTEAKKVYVPEFNPISLPSLSNLLKKQFYRTNKKEFNPKANFEEANQFLWTLLFYFTKNERFYNSPLLFKSLNTPSLDKGLLVIGGFGCGKTSVFKTFYQLFFNARLEPYTKIKDIENQIQNLYRYQMFFKYFTANKTVEEYENCQTPADKELFWKKHNTGFSYYDDLLTEREASNYGKFELFKDILEKRYEIGSKTMVSCNYYGENKSVEETLQEFGYKYGDRVYDRLFSMFNIIELKGKSLRK